MTEQMAQVIAMLQSQHQEQMKIQREQSEQMIRVLMNQLETSKQQVRQVPVFPQFRKDQEDWTIYIERFEQHLEAHQVTDEAQRRAQLLSCVGEDIYVTIKKICPEDPKTLTFSELKQKLADHFEKRVHVVTSRYKFFQTKLKPGQTHAEWVAELKGLAKSCKFKCEKRDCANSYASSMIRDMVILHTPINKVRMEAIRVEDPALEEVMKIATTYEMSENLETQMNTTEEVSKVTTMGKERAEKKLKSCPGCEKNHKRSQCWFKEAICRFCKKIGHIQSVCLKKKLATVTQRQKPKSVKDGNNRSEEMEIDQIQTVNLILNPSEETKMKLQLEILGRYIEFQIDTGATVNIINLTTYQQLGAPRCASNNAKLKSYQGNIIPVKGQVEMTSRYKGVQRKLRFVVVNRHDVQNIFGMEGINAFGFTLEDNVMSVQNLNKYEEMEDICHEFPEVFAEGLGHCTNYKAHITMKENCQPKFCKARPVPFNLQEQVKEELQRWVDEGVLKPVNASEWATPLVIIKTKW